MKDPLEDGVRRAAAELFPALITSASFPKGQHVEAVRAFQTEPAFARFVAAVEADTGLAALREDPPTAFGVYWLCPDGDNWRDSPTGTALGIFWRALQSILLRGERLTEAGVASEVIENLRSLRRALTGHPVTGTMAVEIRNLNLLSGNVATALGDLVSVPAKGLTCIPSANADVAFVRRYETALDWTTEAKFDRDWIQPNFVRRKRMDRVPLQTAFHLSGLDLPLFGIQTMLWPFKGAQTAGMASWAEHKQELDGGRFAFDEDGRRAIIKNAQLLADGYSPSLDVAYSRIVRAVTQVRFAKAEALVDSVVAWEAMFGSNTETTFRVTGASSRLLEADDTKRLEHNRRLKKIYTLRSKLVHGAISDHDPEITWAASEALDVATEALRAVHCLPEKLRNLSSSDRSAWVLLGVPLT